MQFSHVGGMVPLYNVVLVTEACPHLKAISCLLIENRYLIYHVLMVIILYRKTGDFCIGGHDVDTTK